MKIAVPVIDGQYSVPLAKATEFAVFTVENGVIQMKDIIFSPPNEIVKTSSWLHRFGINLVIVGCIGPKTYYSLVDNDLRIIYGSPCLSPAELVKQYLKENLN